MATLENGKTYIVNHCRKGRFAMRIDHQCDEWAHGQVVGGTAKAMLDYNIKETGEPISVRKSHVLTAVEQP